ncbi:hypothetical protein BamMEX5DRAFT_6476 [Burkholderia ambifaria MEX-5]|uniref:Uncharacterized protein n=1 Tax=Burkholderia ambifaria MEX-5 TaxID=396597 RepID=B1TFB0_9BURK|nr:hypothetical protein BamMEX5DRAFT_6476 [Burkholderia ambifaria MEX-5]
MSELIGLIHPHPIDHFAAVLGHDVVQVEDDFRLRTLFPDFHFIGRGHVDCYRFDTLGNPFGKLFEEGPSRLARASRPDPEHLPADWLDHHGGVAMALMQRELVHRQIADR